MALVTATTLKTWLGITDALDDANLATAASAADRAVKSVCRREFEDAVTPAVRWFEAFTPYEVYVDDFHTTTGLIVATDDNDDGTAETTWTASDYQTEPANRTVDGVTWPYTSIRAVDAHCFPKGRRLTQVSVTARWGFASSVPGDITTAAHIWASRLFRRKDTPEGLGGGGEFGVIRVNSKPDPDVMAMLTDYIRPIAGPAGVLIGS